MKSTFFSTGVTTTVQSVSSALAGVLSTWWVPAVTAPLSGTTTTTAGHHGYGSAITAALAATARTTVVTTIAVAASHSSRCFQKCYRQHRHALQCFCSQFSFSFSTWLICITVIHVLDFSCIPVCVT